jgi:hypothetical protein
VPAELRRLIRRIATENPTWGEERIADELLLKLQIRISPRTLSKYMGRLPRTHGSQNRRWATYLHNHEHEMVACDFFVAVTARFRIVYIRALEIGSRRLVHFNVTARIRRLTGCCSNSDKCFRATALQVSPSRSAQDFLGRLR